MFFYFGLDIGSVLFGILFQAVGTRITLIIYAVMTAILLAVLLCYLKLSKDVSDYEKLPVDGDDKVENGDAD